MSEEIGNEFSGSVTEEEVNGTLPSEEVEVQNFVPEGFDEFVKNNTSENGKLYGQFDNIQQALEHFREQEIKHTNNMRELKNEHKSKEEEVKTIQNELKTTKEQEAGLQEMIPDFIANDMTINEDMIAKIEELGLDVKDVQLEAYKVKEKANHMKKVAFETVGGEEEYSAMMEWANENLDDDLKSDFQKSLEGMSDNEYIGKLAIKGLHSMYKNGDKVSGSKRIEGFSKPNEVVGGYTNQEELFADRRASQKNRAMKERYLKRLAMTDDKILSLY